MDLELWVKVCLGSLKGVFHLKGMPIGGYGLNLGRFVGAIQFHWVWWYGCTHGDEIGL